MVNSYTDKMFSPSPTVVSCRLLVYCVCVCAVTPVECVSHGSQFTVVVVVVVIARVSCRCWAVSCDGVLLWLIQRLSCDGCQGSSVTRVVSSTVRRLPRCGCH